MHLLVMEDGKIQFSFLMKTYLWRSFDDEFTLYCTSGNNGWH